MLFVACCSSFVVCWLLVWCDSNALRVVSCLLRVGWWSLCDVLSVVCVFPWVGDVVCGLVVVPAMLVVVCCFCSLFRCCLLRDACWLLLYVDCCVLLL